MKASRFRRIAHSMLFLAVAGCGGGDPDPMIPPDPPRPTTIAISPESAELTYISQVTPFSATVHDQYGAAMAVTVTWSSSDDAVFTVDGTGRVTATGNGSGSLQASVDAINATASITVSQRAATVMIVSGDNQEGRRDEVLPEPIVARVEDRGGFGVAGLTLTFRPATNNGSVSAATVEADENGEAMTEWTLGDRFGNQSLIVSVPGGILNSASARAIPENLLPDLNVASVSVSRQDPTQHEMVEVEVVISNEGDGDTPETFPVRLSVDGTALETVDAPLLAAQNTTTVAFMAIGPFETGNRRLVVTADPDEEFDELDEANNDAAETLVVLHQQLITPRQGVTVSSSTVDEVFLFRVDITEASDELLNVELSGGTGDADLFVHYGDRPDHHYNYRCLSGNDASDELCQMVPTRVGPYHVAVNAFTAFGPSTLTVTVGGKPVETFDIELVFLDGGTASQDQVMRDAAKRWESVIARGAEDFTYQEAQPAGRCGPGSPAIVAGDMIDDVRIYITIGSIDGVGGIVGQASPCSVRQISFVPSEPILREILRGFIELDEDDVNRLEAQGALISTVTHEFGHVLGFGSLWESRGFLKDPSVDANASADTHFDGPLAVAAFNAIGGRSYRGAKVPVQSGGAEGMSDGHWRESVFGMELMTPFIELGAQPLSRITVESLADLGYEVNLSAADQYRVTGAGAPDYDGPVIYLGDDIARIPIRVFDQKGRLVRVIPPLR